MKILVKFGKEFDHQPIEKDISPMQTIENLEVIISLSIPEFNTYDLYYKNKRLNKKDAKLADVVDTSDPNIQINVIKKGSSILLFDQANSIKQSLLGNINTGNSNILQKLAPVGVVLVLFILAYAILG